MNDGDLRSQGGPSRTDRLVPLKTENGLFYPALDGLRAIAFLMVFMQHYFKMPWGWTGVDLFFVLSGFLITGILFDSRNDPYRARNFYVRRTLRIFPLYYGIMLLLLFLEPIVRWDWSWRWLVWPAYVGNFARFVHPYLLDSPLQRLADFQPSPTRFHTHLRPLLGHFWSLCIEEQFYLIWPWLVFWVRDRRKLIYICAAVVVLCPLLRVIGQHSLPVWMLDNEILYRTLPFRFDALLLGGLLALLLRGRHAAALLQTARFALWFSLASVLIWALLTPARHIFSRPYPYPSWHFTWGLSIIDGLAALLILSALQPRTLAFRVLNIRPLRWLGRISYGAYVLHDIPHLVYGAVVFTVLHSVFGTQAIIATALIALVGTILLAWFSFRFLESPFLALKERWTIRTPQGPNARNQSVEQFELLSATANAIPTTPPQ